MNVVIKIGLSLPAREGVPVVFPFHAFFLWLCDLVACLSAIPLSPSIMHRFSILYSPPFNRGAEPRKRSRSFVPFKAMLPPQQRTIARSLFLCRCLLHIDYSHLGISTWSQSALRHFLINANSAVMVVEFLPLKRESGGQAESFI